MTPVFFLCVLSLVLVLATLAPGTDRDQFFWQTFFNAQDNSCDWPSLVAAFIHFGLGPVLSFAFYVTNDKLFFRQARLSILICLFAVFCWAGYHFFCLLPIYIASFFEVSISCVPNCSVCVVSLKEKITELALHSSAFLTYFGAVFLALKPVSILKSKNRSFFIFILFLFSFVITEISRRYSWAEWCIHQGFH